MVGDWDTDAYDKRWRDREAAGEQVHGEADLVSTFQPQSVLDAGCGTGRVAIELARRGCRVVGADRDPQMIAAARAKAPELEWHESDLASLDLGDDRFDVVVMAGNVMIFVDPGTEPAVIQRAAACLAPGSTLR